MLTVALPGPTGPLKVAGPLGICPPCPPPLGGPGGVPQGSVLGPLCFVLYTSDVFNIAHQQGFFIHGYADDLQLYQHCLPRDSCALSARFSSCMERIRSWMASNRLRLNPSKTEVIWLGSTRRLANASTPTSVTVDGCTIMTSTQVRSLGVTIDAGLVFSSHISQLVRTSYYQLRQLRSIRGSLSVDSCHTLVRALILSRLDYCNGLLYGSSAELIGKLDGVMRSAARLILKRQRFDHISTLMRNQLHWLDITARIKYKMCVFAFRCLKNTAPRYLSDYCIPVATLSGRSHLRSAASGSLFVPACRTVTIGPRAFAVACPKSWNSLPQDLRVPGITQGEFRNRLKTVLFEEMLSGRL